MSADFENIIKILEEQAAKTSGLTKRDEVNSHTAIAIEPNTLLVINIDQGVDPKSSRTAQKYY